MAGAGFKDFSVGEVLTASDVDTYLMQQSVMNFADSAARGSALGTATGTAVPLAEGMVSYLQDTDSVEVYDGSAWTAVGGVAAVKTVVKTDTQSASVAAGGTASISGLTISHATANASNKVFLVAQVSATDEQDGRPGAAITAGGTALNVGDAAGSRTRVSGQSDGNPNSVQTQTLTALYSPGSTASVTYGVDIYLLAGLTYNMYVNRSSDDSDNAGRARAASVLTLFEVRG